MNAQPTPVTRVIPDLDDQLTWLLGWLDEILGAYQPDDENPADPATLARDAVHRLWDVIVPTQGDRAPAGRLLAANGRYEHIPVRVIAIDPTDIDQLRMVADDLTGTAPLVSDAEETLRDVAADFTDNPAHPTNPKWLDETISRVVGLVALLATEPGRDAQTLAVAAGRGGPGIDVVLTATEDAAHERWATATNKDFTGGIPEHRYTY